MSRGYRPQRKVRRAHRRLALPRSGYVVEAVGVQVLMAPFTKRRLGPESIREIVFGVEDGLVQNMTLMSASE